MNVPFFDLTRQATRLQGMIENEFRGIIRSGQFTSGERVAAFEKSFARYIGTCECICVSSGTAALQLALLASGVGSGDEVIIPANTFIATAEAISQAGATPVVCDIDPESYTLDVESVRQRVSPAIKAIVPVHLYGQCAPMADLLELAERHQLAVIEDASQAHGAEYGGRRAGSWGRAGCFSFYPSKNLGTWGEGGAVTTNDPALARRVRLLRDHGSREKNVHDCVGGNFRMGELEAAVLMAKLPYLEGWNEQRRKLASCYLQGLGDVSRVELPRETPKNKHVYYLYVIRCEQRDGLGQYLRSQGVGTQVHYPTPVHLQGAYRHLGKGVMTCPVSEQIQKEVLSLPLFPELGPEEVDYVCSRVRLFMASRIGNVSKVIVARD